MLFIKDLRIGDMVNTPICSGEIVGISKNLSVSSYYVTVCSSNCEFKININNINPIPISKEILLKSGFKCIETSFTNGVERDTIQPTDILYNEEIFIHETNDCFYISYIHGEFRFCQDFSQDYNPNFEYSVLTRIKDIHELQNLYVDLLQRTINIIV